MTYTKLKNTFQALKRDHPRENLTAHIINISVSLAITGEPLNSSTAIVTPAAVGDLFNVHVEAIIDVPRGCCLTVALENTSTQTITTQNVNVIVDRVA